MSIFLHFVLFLLAGATAIGHPAQLMHSGTALAAQSHGQRTPLDILEPHP